MNWDVFISHASEDKEDFVKELATKLSRYSVTVWYDEFTLKIGDSLSKSINKGLSNSSYGIIVISKSFIGKGWTDYELRSLINKEIGFRKIILPIWHGVTKSEVQEFSHFLADKFSLNSQDDSLNKIVIKLLEVIRPDIHESIRRRLMFEELVKKGEKRTLDPNETLHSIVRHKTLPKSWLNRIEIVYRTVANLGSSTLEDLVENFKKDLHPDREIKIWETVAASYLEIIDRNKITDKGKQKEIYRVLLGFRDCSLKCV